MHSLFVKPSRRPTVECPLALAALERRAPRMNVLVHLQRARSSKPSVAELARKRSFAGMAQQVRAQIAQALKGHVARVAFVPLLRRNVQMRHVGVAHQFAGRGKGNGAHGALVRSVSLVHDRHVALERRAVREATAALLALERLFAGVYSNVLLQIRLGLER